MAPANPEPAENDHQLPSEPTAQFPYQLEEKIGEGAMGVVYRARDESLDRPVAIKTLRPGFLEEQNPQQAEEASARFLQEARAAAQLNHPGAASIYQVGKAETTAFIAMEWIDGTTLREVLDDRAPLPFEDIIRLGGELLDVLETAHQAGIVHRDLKPENILLDENERLKLTDFGVAHVEDSDLVETQTGATLGTPVYAPPEQIRGRDVDARSDLYTVGVLLYELATGELPFDGRDMMSVINSIVHDSPKPPRERNPSVPSGLEKLIAKAIAKEKSERFQTADRMSESLRRLRTPAESDLHWESRETVAKQLDETTAVEEETAPTAFIEASSAPELVLRTVARWEREELGERNSEKLLQKLLESPLHADPFSGAVKLGTSLFIIGEGLLLAGVDLSDGRTGDVVYENLPPTAPGTLYPVPDELPDRIAMNLASVLYPPERRHSELDPEFTDLGALVDRLADDGFSGAVRVERDSELGFVFIDEGEVALRVFSKGWDPEPTGSSWPQAIEANEALAHVEERRIALLPLSYRTELRNRELQVAPDRDDAHQSMRQADLESLDWRIQNLDSNAESAGRSTMTERDMISSDRMHALLRWLTDDVPDYFAERDRLDRWKYLARWVPEIRRATLYHDLPRPGAPETDHFGLVTFDADGKVLHVARRTPVARPEDVHEFVDDVTEVKESRIEGGDIGAALLVADEIPEETRKAYREAIDSSRSNSVFSSLQESMTNYEGFVRVGPRRGFHFLLVEQLHDGFRPHLPPS